MTDLPSGIVTFLFTDIEGSTRLWERDASAMWAATARHNAILSDVIAQHRGHHFKTIGDAYLAAFAHPADAVAAAVTGQRALAAEPWTETGPIRVRMAIHRGEATPVGGDYVVAPCLNRLARLLAVGHGAQVLLSDAVRREAEAQLPSRVTLRDLGRHRLRDLLEPEQVTQLVVEGLPDTFPPLKSLERHPTNLPIQPNPLIGRETHLEQLKTLLGRDDVHLVTLTGVGGTGKTRLALQVAADLLEAFDDGAFVVDLAPLDQAPLVLPTIAATIGVRETGGYSLRDALVQYLAQKRLLLVLDNFEHLLDAAPIVADLLRTCDGIKGLATSRAPLRLRGEHEYAVSPLAVPDPARLPSVEELAAVDAVVLFVQRATMMRPEFVLTRDNASSVAAICARLDGLPLAIELAAARIRMLEPEALLKRLDRRLKVLTGGARDLPSRQQTLRATIAWSHDLLAADEQTLFRRLSVFAGSGSIEAAEVVTSVAGGLDTDVLDGLEILVNQSLLRRSVGADNELRFTFLETLREFGLERLAEAGEEDLLRQAHAAWCGDFVTGADAALRGPDQVTWLHRLDADHDNFRSALGWAVANGDDELPLRLVRGLWPFWHIRGHLEEGIRWVETALKLGDQSVAEDRLWAQIGAGTLRFARGEYRGAEHWFQRANAIAEMLDQPGVTAMVLNNQGAVAHAQGNLDIADRRYEESLEFAKKSGEQRRYATALLNLGAIAHYRGEEATAVARYEESLGIFRTLGDTAGSMDVLSNLVAIMAPVPDQVKHAQRLGEEALSLAHELGTVQGEAFILACLGFAAETAGEPVRARDLHEQSLKRYRQIGDQDGIARALGNLGAVALDNGEVEQSIALCTESVDLYMELGDPDGVAYAVETLASVALETGKRETAARWLGAVDGLREAAGSAAPAESRTRRERLVARLHQALSGGSLSAELAGGREMTLDELRDEIQLVCASRDNRLIREHNEITTTRQ